MVEFVVYGEPVPQGSMKAIVSKSTGRAVTMPSNQKRLKPWRTEVTQAAIDAQGEAPRFEAHEPVRLTVTFWLQRPKAAKTRVGPTVAPDWDKLARAIGDSLSGICYEDDKQVTTGVVMKRYTDGAPCAVVRVEADSI